MELEFHNLTDHHHNNFWIRCQIKDLQCPFTNSIISVLDTTGRRHEMRVEAIGLPSSVLFLESSKMRYVCPARCGSVSLCLPSSDF